MVNAVLLGIVLLFPIYGRLLWQLLEIIAVGMLVVFRWHWVNIWAQLMQWHFEVLRHSHAVLWR